MTTTPVTVRLTDAEKERISAAATAAGMKPGPWMAQELRRSARRAQIAAYTGPDPDTRQWQELADESADAMMAFTARTDTA